MSQEPRVNLPSSYLNRDTLHIIYVTDVDRALEFMRPWLHGTPIVEVLSKDISQIMGIINNNIFHMTRRGGNLQDQSWFVGNEILGEAKKDFGKIMLSRDKLKL